MFLLTNSLVISPFQASNTWANTGFSATYQFKVTDPRTGAGVANSTVVLLSITNTDKQYQKLRANSSGVVTATLVEGTHYFELYPTGTDTALVARTHAAKVSATSGISFKSGLSTATQPFALELGYANVRGSVVLPSGAPPNITGLISIQGFNTENGEWVSRYANEVNREFGLSLYTGTWKIQARWETSGGEIYDFGVSDWTTVQIDSSGQPINYSPSAGLTLTLKAPTITGVLTLPDGSRVSGWKIVDPDPNWTNIKEGRTQYINYSESSESPSQGSFAIWVDPAYKPSHLKFSVVSGGVGYTKTVAVPAFSTTLNLGTITSETSQSVTVTLPSQNYLGAVALQKRSAGDCNTCWDYVDTQGVEETNSVTFYHLSGTATYRVGYLPNPAEPQYGETFSNTFTPNQVNTTIQLVPVNTNVFTFRITNPVTNAGEANASYFLASSDKTFYRKGVSNSQGVLTLGLPAGIYSFVAYPNSGSLRVTEKTSTIVVANNGGITIGASAGSTTQANDIPLALTNFWGSISIPGNITNSGYPMVIAYNESKQETIYRNPNQSNEFGFTLSEGSWQVRALWWTKAESQIYVYGPSDIQYLTVNSSGVISPTLGTSGLTLTLKEPNVTGTISLPNGSFVSGWMIQESTPDWTKINNYGLGMQKPFYAQESASSGNNGQFALWLDPKNKPDSLDVSINNGGIKYGKTIAIPEFTNTVNLGTITAQVAHKVTVNLSTSSARGAVYLQQRKLTDCEHCWSMNYQKEYASAKDTSQVVLQYMRQPGYDYRVTYSPEWNELQYLDSASISLSTETISSIPLTLNQPSLIVKVPALQKSPEKGYFAELLLLERKSSSTEEVAKGLPSQYWVERVRKSLYQSTSTNFVLDAGVTYRLAIVPAIQSLTSPVTLTQTFVGPAAGSTLGEVTFDLGAANFKGQLTAGVAAVANHQITLQPDNYWTKSLTLNTDANGNYFAKLPLGNVTISAEPKEKNPLYSRNSNTCTVSNVSELKICDLALLSSNLRFRVVDSNSIALSIPIYISRFGDYSSGATNFPSLIQILTDSGSSVEKMKNYDQYLTADANLDYGAKLADGRYLLWTYQQALGVEGLGRVFYQINVLNNQVVYVRSLHDNQELAATDGKYSLAAPAANVKVTLNLDGQNISYIDGYSNRVNELGSFSFGSSLSATKSGNAFDYVAPGKYIYQIYKPSNSDISSKYIWSNRCEVTSLAIRSNCAITLSTNFMAQVRDSNNTVVNGGEITIFERSGELLNYVSHGGTSSTGAIRLALPNGSYQIEINKNSVNSLRESIKLWVQVEAGVVSKVTRRGSTVAIEPNNSLYEVQTNFMGIAGTVVAPDGTTPIAGAQVGAYNNKAGFGASTRDNGQFEISNIQSDGEYQVLANAPSGLQLEMGASNPVAVTVNGGVGSNNVVLALRSTTARGTVYGLNGAVKGGYLEVRRSVDGSTAQWNYVGGAPINESGKFGIVLSAGTYYFETRNIDWRDGGNTISNVCNVPESGYVTCDITLPQNNFIGKVLNADGSNSKLATISGKLIRGDAYGIMRKDYFYTNTDNDGLFKLNLTDGEWHLYISPRYENRFNNYPSSFLVKVASGQIVSVETADATTQTTIQPTNGIHELRLRYVNLSGRLTFQGSSENFYSGVRVMREVSNEKGNWVEWVAQTSTRENGQYELNVPAGTYILEAIPYVWSSKLFTSGLPAFTRYNNCVVPSSGSVTCNIQLNSANILGKITDTAGVPVSRTSINIVKLDVNGNYQYTDRGIYVDSEAQFGSYLENGTYRITITPWWENRLNLIERSYRVTVVAGAVTEVRDLISNQTLNVKADGRYVFKYGTPSVVGTVLMPGTSTEVAANVRIEVRNTAGNVVWEYTTHTNNQGQFSLALPDGEYQVGAVNDGQIRGAFKSVRVSVTVAAGSAPSITLRLREANLTGRVVQPGTTTPVANVNVNLYIDGEWNYTWTDETGVFGMYVENPSPACPDRCRVYLNTWAISGFLPKNYPISAIGNRGDFELGAANTRVSVLVPQPDGSNKPNIGGWLYAEKIDQDGNSIGSSWANVEKSGFGYLALGAGFRYRIHAYPGEQYVGSFSRKILDIASHVQSSAQVDYEITFDTPNLNLTVRGWDTFANAWGYYRVINSSQNVVLEGSLNNEGKAALLLTQNGTYSMTIYPGKAKGVPKVVSLQVTNSVITSTDITITNGAATFDLPRGNVEGITQYSGGAIAKEVLITASRSDQPAVVEKTASSTDGKYFLNLNRDYTWNIAFFDPATGQSGSLVLTPTTTNFTLGFAAGAAA